jgi:hypothetical protein
MEIAPPLDPQTASPAAMVFLGRRPSGQVARAALVFGFSTAIAFGMSLTLKHREERLSVSESHQHLFKQM